MLPLRYAGFWRLASVIILTVVLLAAMLPTLWFDNRVHALSWFENADKWIHGLTFIVLSLWFAGLCQRRRYGWIAGGLMLFGFLVEGCQLLVSYRMADWLDIAANTAGIILGLTVAAAGLGGWGLRFEDWYSRRSLQ